MGGLPHRDERDGGLHQREPAGVRRRYPRRADRGETAHGRRALRLCRAPRAHGTPRAARAPLCRAAAQSKCGEEDRRYFPQLSAHEREHRQCGGAGLARERRASPARDEGGGIPRRGHPRDGAGAHGRDHGAGDERPPLSDRRADSKCVRTALRGGLPRLLFDVARTCAGAHVCGLGHAAG